MSFADEFTPINSGYIKEEVEKDLVKIQIIGEIRNALNYNKNLNE